MYEIRLYTDKEAFQPQPFHHVAQVLREMATMIEAGTIQGTVIDKQTSEVVGHFSHAVKAAAE